MMSVSAVHSPSRAPLWVADEVRVRVSIRQLEEDDALRRLLLAIGELGECRAPALGYLTRTSAKAAAHLALALRRRGLVTMTLQPGGVYSYSLTPTGRRVSRHFTGGA